MQGACAVPCFCSPLFRSGNWDFWSFCIFLSIICPNCTCTQLFLVPCSFFVFCPGASIAAKGPRFQVPACLTLISPACPLLSLLYRHSFPGASEPLAAPQTHQALPCLGAFVHTVLATWRPLPPWLSGEHLLSIGPFTNLRHHSLLEAFLNGIDTSPTIVPPESPVLTLFSVLSPDCEFLEDRDSLLWSNA